MLSDASVPYDTALHFALGDTTLDFMGTMTAPPDLDKLLGTRGGSRPDADVSLAIDRTPDILLAVRLAAALRPGASLYRTSR